MFVHKNIKLCRDCSQMCLSATDVLVGVTKMCPNAGGLIKRSTGRLNADCFSKPCTGRQREAKKETLKVGISKRTHEPNYFKK